jgi:hypothetical protein
MKNVSGTVIHLVEFINAADTSVRENQSTAFKNDFFSLWIFGNVNGQTNR